MPDPHQNIGAFTPEFAQQIRDFVRQEIGKTPGAKGLPNPLINARPVCLVKVTSNAAGKEKYKAKLLSPGTVEISSSTDLAEADLGILSDTENVLFLNCENVAGNGSGHILTEDGDTPYAIGLIVGYNTETPPLLVVRGLSLLYGDCTT